MTEDKPKFTPGPWECSPSIPEDGFECFWIRARRDFGPLTRGFRIVDIGSVNGPQWAEQKANAHAISAVPDMYEALREARAFIAGELTQYLECACVLDKDSLEPLRHTLDESDREFIEGIEATLAKIDAALAKAEGRES